MADKNFYTKQWLNLGVEIVIFFANLDMGKILFEHEPVCFIGFVLANFIFFSGMSFLEDRTYYIYADSVSEYNPLYVRKYFRKNPGKPIWGANLKGLFYCQVCLGAVTLWSWGSMLSLKWTRFLFSSKIALRVMGCVYWIIFLTWITFRTFYCWRYNEDFRYLQNSEGIWQPYSNITKTHNIGFYKPFHNHYYVRYKRMQENLRMSCPVNGYQYVDSYEMGNREGESDLYVKYMRDEIRIFQFIHVREYTEDTMKQLNEIFSDFWKAYIGSNKKAEKASLLFLLCVEKYSKELTERLLSVCSVDQKKGRNRVAAVITYYGKPSLTILDSYGMVRGKKKYRELRAEMLTLLGMSEKNNHRSYGDKEEYGELKEISEEDLNAILDDIEFESQDL